jgi:hypothetical protein
MMTRPPATVPLEAVMGADETDGVMEQTILIHLSGEEGQGWTVIAVDRATRRWAVGEAGRQLDAAEDAFERLYPGE